MKRTAKVLSVALAAWATAAIAATPPASSVNTFHPRAATAGSGTWDSGPYQYDALGNITNIGADSYLYDSAQRLVSGTADVQRSQQMNEQHYGYDAFGNRIAALRAPGSKACVNGTPCELAVVVDPSTNHLASNGATYDAAGNLTVYAGAHYNYDALSMMVQELEGGNDLQFVYTPDDERLAVDRSGSWTWSVRGVEKDVLREFTSADAAGAPGSQGWAWTEDYVARNGTMVASVEPSGQSTSTLHFHVDHLGTARLITDAHGIAVANHAYYPFGAELDLAPREHPEESHKFTGHERDLTGDVYALDYMHARYYSGGAGRFLSADKGSLHLAPQSFNRYTYASDSPINNVDFTGFCSADPFFRNVYYNVAASPLGQLLTPTAYADPKINEQIAKNARDENWFYSHHKVKKVYASMGLAFLQAVTGDPEEALGTLGEAGVDYIWSVRHPFTATIGENMPDRVAPTSEELGAWSGDGPDTESRGDNRQWLADRICDGMTIYDLGRDPERVASGQGISPYYRSERAELTAAHYTEHADHVVMVNGKATMLYRWDPPEKKK